MPGPDCASQSIDGFREQLFEFFKALVALVRSIGIGQEKPYDQTDPGEQNLLLPQEYDDRKHYAAACAQPQEVADPDLQVRLLQELLQGGNTLRAPQQSINRRNLAQHL